MNKFVAMPALILLFSTPAAADFNLGKAVDSLQDLAKVQGGEPELLEAIKNLIKF